MYHSERELQRSFDARRSEVLNLVADYRHLAPAALAARERLKIAQADHAIPLVEGSSGDRAPGAIRRWFGSRLVRLGTWLGGIATSPDLAPDAAMPHTHAVPIGDAASANR
jgi:hypothetical protein